MNETYQKDISSFSTIMKRRDIYSACGTKESNTCGTKESNNDGSD
jgi:hypothetical protein